MWRVPLCFMVAGLPRTQGELVLERLAADADSAGVRLAGERCHPNLIVAWSREPEALLTDLKRRNPRMFGDAARAVEIGQFIRPSKPKAVRVWHNADSANRDGVPLKEFGLICDLDPEGIGPDCPINNDIIESRLSLDRLVVFSSAIVVVDANLARHATLEQLADYIAMVALADIDPDNTAGDAPSILQLFAASTEAAPSGLSMWDRAFLSGLYHSDQSSRGQRWAIEESVVHTVAR